MNWKIILIGGAVYSVVLFLTTVVGAPVFHMKLMAPYYHAYPQFWPPGFLDPNEGSKLIPRALTTMFIRGIIVAGIYGWLRTSLQGGPWLRGAKYGALLWLFNVAMAVMWTGFFVLPDALWALWMLESSFDEMISATVLGWVVHKVAPLEAAARVGDVRTVGEA